MRDRYAVSAFGVSVEPGISASPADALSFVTLVVHQRLYHSEPKLFVTDVAPWPSSKSVLPRAAGHKDGGWLTQQLSDLLLERRDQLALPVAIGRGLG